MENFENVPQSQSQNVIDGTIKNYLVETSRWGKFLAIVGYVGMGLLLLLGFAVVVGFSVFNRLSWAGFPVGLFGFIYIGIAVAYYFPITYMYNFSRQIRQGLESNDQQTITTGFENLKSLFKFMGIFTIVILSLYALMLVIAIPIALVAALH